MNTLADRLLEVMDELEIKTQKDLADFAGVSKGLVAQWFRGDTQLGRKPLLAFEKKTNYSTRWLAEGVGEKYRNASVEGAPRRESNVRDFGRFHLWSKNDPLPEDEYVHLPFYKEVRMKGGSGSFEMEDYNGYTLPFAKATLYRYNVDTERSFCCTLDGDSMEPVIPDGATIGISVGDDRIKDGKIYAFEHDGLFRVKRLFLMPGGQVRINSYNQDDPAYADEFAPLEDIRIIGRVFTWSVLV